ncbi:alanyl-tRNA editing protein [Bhargavaea beijingensis]|uniref:Alanyl-tRNA editing protein n=1 Tax=Bhargavaea beijingensis TaxID=426756 RepID=A0A1G7HAE7_9BACL|nr:DHHA1 domain-containing protein [Bhargavaea beijingensis]MCW1928535.1 DHHA1 domain-containing protein [Bhargavaea beijingensis]RSK25357.1 alanyl-tRNA editing protein [Bhargavaea beijingensis]SDE97341.1 alanyl-tRNA synthetase [Bhargavaea beijingensis]
MLKDRLYYKDPYRTTFKANVIREGVEDGRPFAVLENTLFYPTGGGQPHDTGKLNGIRVTDVEEKDGEILHYVEKPLNALVVSGKIDWTRRHDHMQQHTGQHILTAAFIETAGCATVSFHLGSESVSIDLDTEHLIDEQLEAAEKRANEIIRENRAIETRWVTEGELDRNRLRKEIAVDGEIRLVIIPDYDYNGCGGTHPYSTGEVGQLKILGMERVRKKTRIHFVCGNRILDQLEKKNRILKEAVGMLSVPEENTTEAIRRLLDTNRALEKQLAEAEGRLLEMEARSLVTTGPLVKASFKDRPIGVLQKLGRAAATAREDAIVLLTVRNGGKLQFVAARGSEAKVSMKQVAAAALEATGGKGGGSETFVQGGGDTSLTAEELLSVMASAIE